MNEKPLIITGESYKLYGIIREAENASKLVILSPWVMGDRTGVTRIYVEAAREMLKHNISSYCVDMPQINYSFDPKLSNDYYVEFYASYLEKVLLTMQEKFPQLEKNILAFCSSAIPAIYISRKYGLSKVITLNPFNFPKEYVKRPVHESFVDYVKFYNNKISMLHIVSEKENDVLEKREYLRKYFEDENCAVSIEHIVGANHSFDGWMIKKQVIEKLVSWLKN
jgi:hypothetical protein